MRTFQACVVCVASLFFGVWPTRAVERPVEKRQTSPVAAPLKGVEFVEAKALTETGNILTPRKDSRVPKLMVDLLRDEDIVRMYPWCTFAMVDGHPVWRWHSSMASGIFEKNREALRVRLVARLRKHGFQPLPGTPDSIPGVIRSGKRPFKYRKTEQGRELTVEFDGFAPWTGGRRPAVGINIAIIIRGTRKIATPKLSEVTAAFSTIAAPTHGKRTIPPAIIELLERLPVTIVRLSGTGKTWYSLSIATPQSSLKKFRLQERIEAILIAANFEKDVAPNNPRETKTIQLLHYRASKGISNCRIGMDKLDGNCRIHLSVQP